MTVPPQKTKGFPFKSQMSSLPCILIVVASSLYMWQKTIATTHGIFAFVFFSIHERSLQILECGSTKSYNSASLSSRTRHSVPLSLLASSELLFSSITQCVCLEFYDRETLHSPHDSLVTSLGLSKSANFV